MAIALLGPDTLRGLLAGRGTIRVVNRTAVDDAVVILAATIVRHRSSAAPVADAVFGLDLQGEESIELLESPPMAEPPQLIEALLRLVVGPLAETVDAYVTATRSTDNPDATFEVGVRRHDGNIGDGEDALPGFAEFAAYGLPAD